MNVKLTRVHFHRHEGIKTLDGACNGPKTFAFPSAGPTTHTHTHQVLCALAHVVTGKEAFEVKMNSYWFQNKILYVTWADPDLRNEENKGRDQA